MVFQYLRYSLTFCAPSQEGIGIDPGLNVVTTMAPLASREQSHPQAILKFYCPSSLGYTAHYGLRARHNLKVLYFVRKL